MAIRFIPKLSARVRSAKPQLDLDCGLLVFDAGEWRLQGAESGGGSGQGSAKEVGQLRRRVKVGASRSQRGPLASVVAVRVVRALTRRRCAQALEEENNMLRYKMEVLIDMVSPTHPHHTHTHALALPSSPIAMARGHSVRVLSCLCRETVARGGGIGPQEGGGQA